MIKVITRIFAGTAKPCYRIACQNAITRVLQLCRPLAFALATLHGVHNLKLARERWITTISLCLPRKQQQNMLPTIRKVE